MAAHLFQYVRNTVREHIQSPIANALYLIGSRGHAADVFSECLRQGWEKAFDNKEVILAMVHKYPKSWLQLVISSQFRKYCYWLAEPEVALLSCRKNSTIFYYIDKSQQENEAVIQTALRTHHHNHGYMPNAQILGWLPSELKQQYAELAVSLNGLALRYVPTKTDRITMIAVQHNGEALQFATKEQRNNLLFVRVAVYNMPDIVSSNWFPQLSSENMKDLLEKVDQRRRHDMEQTHWDHDHR